MLCIDHCIYIYIHQGIIQEFAVEAIKHEIYIYIYACKYMQ